MKKTLISIMAALAVIVAVLCMGLTMTACAPTSYTFKVVYEDGTPVNGLTDGTYGSSDNEEENTLIKIQICATDPTTGEVNGFCTTPKTIGADGTIEVTESDFNGNKLQDNQKWHVQLLGVKKEYSVDDFYLDGYGTYEIVLHAAN